jgi:hypothetical protein
VSDVKLWCPDDGGMVRAYRAEGKVAPIDQEYSKNDSFVAKEDYDSVAAENAAMRAVLKEYMETYNVDFNGYVHDSGAMLDLEDRARSLLGEPQS